uniref:Uncharacterized protein n=1 Tax=Kalanchoe fedtschenkoi TaxID=63787 RepID=A0A7N0TAA6_KALFE
MMMPLPPRHSPRSTLEAVPGVSPPRSGQNLFHLSTGSVPSFGWGGKKHQSSIQSELKK